MLISPGLQTCQQQAGIRVLAADVQSAAGSLDSQIRRWEGAAVKLDRSLRAAGDVENLLASVEQDIVQIAELLTQLAKARQHNAASGSHAS